MTALTVLDENAEQEIIQIDWSMLEPNATATRTVNVRNEGNTPVTLTITTQNWTPETASEYIHFSTDYTGATIQPAEIARITFTLHISAEIHDITAFTFNIIITASG